MSGGGAKVHRYPPTMAPIIKDASMQPIIFLFLKAKIVRVATKLAMGPKTTSKGFNDPKAIMPPTVFPTKQPSVAPQITGQPNNAAKGSRQSATLS
jgi:hypothetical protein